MVRAPVRISLLLGLGLGLGLITLLSGPFHSSWAWGDNKPVGEAAE
jgi:hypothetical protein